MAVSNTAATDTREGSFAQRFSIGANVVLAVVVAAAILVVVNMIAAKKSYRHDITSTGNYGLSDRTKSVLDGLKGDVTFSMLYRSGEDDEAQRNYVSRTQEYFDEMQRYSPAVRSTLVTSPMQREKLVAHLSEKFSGEADQHKAALGEFEKLRAELLAVIEQRVAEAGQLVGGQSWLSDFPVFTSIFTTLKADVETLKKVHEEIAELTPAGGIPKYKDAVDKAKTALGEVKGHLELITKRMRDLSDLGKDASQPDARNIATLRKVAEDLVAMITPLREAVGDDAAPFPKDIPVALKSFADAGVKVGADLEGLVRKVDAFARMYPAATQHLSWAASVQMGPLTARMDVGDVLQQASQTLSKARLVILGVIDSNKPDQLNEALRGARQNVQVMEQNAESCQKLLSDLCDRLATVDPASKAFLDAAAGGSLFGDKVEAVTALDGKFATLPELKLGSMADTLKEENSIIVEYQGRLRLVGFNEAWPVRESFAGQGTAAETARSFNGDSALSSALLGLMREKPFATVVLTFFEPPPPQQRNQFMPPPPQSWVPSNRLSELRKRLEASNFKVIEWNMATTPEMPKAEEGTQPVYVCLPPPPPAQQSPFGPQQGEKNFGEPERMRIKQLLDENARVLFLASWEITAGGMFGGPPVSPPYGYGPILATDWGIAVDNSQRVVWIQPDVKAANSFQVVPRKFIHMPVGVFSDHPISHPMTGTRFLVQDACLVKLGDKLPDGVLASQIVGVSDSENYVAANIDTLMEIIDKVQDPTAQGRVTVKAMPPHGPFNLMVAAERKEGDKEKGRIVVCGFGAALRDDFLSQPVWSEGDTLKLDPPPAENVDLFVNALYWLINEPQWIARGPVPVPRVEPIEPARRKLVQAFVWGIWPAAVFIPGVILWSVRRR